jgi:peptide chain release factor 1
MFERIPEIEARYQELEDKLGQPELARDPGKLRDLTRELASLRELITAYRQWKAAGTAIDENEELARDPDAEIRELAEAELKTLRARQAELETELKKLLTPRDPLDQKSVVLEIRPGTGGEEAGLFANDLFRMFTRYAQGRGWSVEVLSLSEGDGGGVREVIASIGGDAVYGRLKYESGVHRVQRVPTTESQGRIHTSTATVAVLPEADTADVSIDEKDLRIDRFRAGGPGGQSVNTTDSAVRITHLPTGIVVTCQDERSQLKNRIKAMTVLRTRLYEMELERRQKEMGDERRSQVGTGDRSEKIRTYNFPDDRVTDHRIKLTVSSVPRVLEGDLDNIVQTLRLTDQAERLKREGLDGSDED